jgi:AraC family transcriptional regulator
MRFKDGAYINATPRQHLIWFLISPKASFDCRIGGRELRHEPLAGSLAICPAGIEAIAEATGTLDTLLVAIDHSQLALAAAEEAAIEAQLRECLSGNDDCLLRLARMLESESADNYPEGSLYWHELSGGFFDRLISGHTRMDVKRRAPGMLGNDVLRRLRGYVRENLDQPINVATLAGIAGRSPFHFTRIFTRSVGISPHRYVVHLRLQRAVELLREGDAGFAEIAARTGFADQSHLSRWVRRAFGVTLTQIAG